MKSPHNEISARKGQPLGMPPARFLRDYWQKRPLLIRGAFPDFTPPLQPDDLAGLACMEGALARIVTRATSSHSSFRGRAKRGIRNPLLAEAGEADSRSRLRRVRNDEQWSVTTGPFDDDTFAKLPESHWTLLVQDVDKWETDSAALLDAFAFIPSWRVDDVMISYATDGGGVGAHVDQYDVFLLQGLGQRRWAIDTKPNPSTDFREDVELKQLKQFVPTHEWVLQPGDMLYLPPGVPHDGVAVGECMTFSIGMRAPSAAEMLTDFAHGLAEQLPEELRYADPDLDVVRASGEIDDAAFARVAAALPWINVDTGKLSRGRANGISESSLRTWFGCFITRYRIAQVPVPRKRPIDRAMLAERLPHSLLERDPYSRFAWCRNSRDATLFATGRAFDAPLAWARELAGRARNIDGAKLARLPQREQGIGLLAELIDAGHLRMARRRTRN